MGMQRILTIMRLSSLVFYGYYKQWQEVSGYIRLQS